jgi:predicted ATPase
MNSWYVITGAPSSGKSTVIDSLTLRGHKTLPEAARVLLEQDNKAGIPTEVSRADERAFQERALKAKIDIEASLPPDEPIFMDRAVPDTIAYYRLYGWPEDDLLKAASDGSHYRKVFILDRLPYRTDGIRLETNESAAKLDSLLESVYRELGVQVERIPVMRHFDRVDLILSKL